MKNKLIWAGVFVSFLVPIMAGAATFMTEKDGNILVKSASEIRDNIYAVGKSISVQQVVFGDLISAGAAISVTENISDDIWAAGATVSILGGVGGDARLAGSNVTINSPVSKDLLAAGGTLNMLQKTIVGGDMVLAGGIITFDGLAQKSARIYGGEIVINGSINGDAVITTDEKLSFGPGAKVKGNLTYRAKKEMEIPAGVVEGKITFEEKGGRTGGKEGAWAWLAALWGGFVAVKFLVLLIGALVLVKFAPVFSRLTMENALDGLGRGFLRGLIVAIVTPIVAIFFLATILGALVGGVLLAAYALMLILAKAVSAVIFGSWLAKIIKRDGLLHISWKTAALGALVLSLLFLIPVVGWIILVFVFLVSLGAISSYIYEKLWLSAK